MSFVMNGIKTGKRYKFIRRHVIQIEDADYDWILGLTSADIPWCQINDKNIPPFMPLEDWCSGKDGRYDSKPFKIYNPQLYRDNMLAK